MKLARIKRVTAVALAGESLPSGLTRGSTREARRVGVPATYSVLAEESPRPSPPPRRAGEERSIAWVD